MQIEKWSFLKRVGAVQTESGDPVASVHGSGTGSEIERRGRVIAAAPEMLDLLRETTRPGAYGINSTLAQRITDLIDRLA